ncbi:uncharacterized protein LOC119357213 [Triticum dicoccoides]|uniref:uncharacterized protein LOC119357213 n=1 Tax=Triticum dicoccoides TaxID=85692 RepID=UPI00188E4270|nr:uncharacterized protein LOC119357213 [Triticum dicoccoides]
MAELASAVSTLLSVISHEAQRLGRVRRDVQFIKEEIESMSSFLEDLSRESCEHNKQVQTWMKQVRILADDCKSRIDLYLYRGDPRFHLPRGGPRRYLLWAPWQLRKLLAQHHAADQLSELKDRAHDISNRRLRYGVEIKMVESSSSSKMAESSSSSSARLTEPLWLHGDGTLKVALPMTSRKLDKEDYFRRRLDHWIGMVVQKWAELATAGSKPLLPSILFVVQETKDADALGSEALNVAKAYFKRAEDAQDKGMPSETCVLPHEDKALPQEIEAVSALGHEDKSAVPPKGKDVNALSSKIRECHQRPRRSSLLCMKIRCLCLRRRRMSVPPETKDDKTLAHEDKVDVPSETKGDGGALVYEDKADVHPETKGDGGPLVHEDKANVPAETKGGGGTLAHEDNADVPSETKGGGSPLAHEDKADVPSETKGGGGPLAHEDYEDVPLETKGSHGPFGHEDKADMPAETKGNVGALAHEDKVDAGVETKGDGGALAHEDKADVPTETKDGPLAHDDKADVPSESKGDGGENKTNVPAETKGYGAILAHEYKADMTAETMGDGGSLEHEDKADVPSKTKGGGMHEDKVDVQSETKGDGNTLAHEEKADVSPETKDAGNVVLVDVPMVHYMFVRLRPHMILYYILAEIKRQQAMDDPPGRLKLDTYFQRKETMGEIKKKIETMSVDKKIEAIKEEILKLQVSRSELSEMQKLHIGGKTLADNISGKTLGQLFWVLIYQSTSPAASEQGKKIKSMVAQSYDVIIKQTAKELQLKIELEEKLEYEDILWKVFPNSITTTANSTPRTMVDDIIKDMVKKEVKEMLPELQELGMPDSNREAGSEGAQKTPEIDFVGSTENMMEEIKMKITEQIKVKMVVQKIQECLRGNQKILLILKVYDKYVPQWEETRNSLSLLGLECPIAGAVIVAKITREDNMQYFGCPGSELIEYSPVGLYFDTVLQVTSQYMNDQNSHQVLRDILWECKQDEFCMKIFAHAFYAKPNRSTEELRKLHYTIRSSPTHTLPSIMLKFSYRELPKEYMSCLLYLAIFPQGQTIRRSTLIGRWVAERLITTKDWRWSSSVYEAEKCFDTLVDRYLVCPAGIGATGKVKSCTVHKLVYGFITKIAMQQHILETRLSHHLARHFSVFSDVRLRSSETIEDFFKKSSQFYKLKVVDLEGCHCFQQKNKFYLRDICKNILMLKYLSLRRTDVTRLPSEINNLQELEVLDIRETKIPASATRNILLRMLKLLLVGHVDSSPSCPDFPSVQMPEKIQKMEHVEVPCNVKLQNGLQRLLSSHVDSSHADYSSVQIPVKIEKMKGVEVLSNVKPKNHRDLVNIGTLNNLKKLGVAINKESYLKPLLNAISDLLNHSLRFLSITLDISIHKDPAAEVSLENKPKYLESLTINGSKKCPEDIKSTSTQMGKLLKSLTEYGNQLAKVNISCTFLSQENLMVLGKLENLHCVKLRHSAYNESKLTFNKGEFENLNKFLVEGNNMAEITFDNGAASNLEKIVLSSTDIVSISGVNCLQKLEELELKGINNKDMVNSLFDKAKHIGKVTLRDTMLEQGDLKILAGNNKMCSLVLLGKFYNGSHVIFEDEFQKLNLLIVHSSESDITEISFTNRSPNLEKIVWSFKEIVSLSGIDKLPALKELELKGGDSVPNKLKEDIKKQKIRLDYKPRDRP